MSPRDVSTTGEKQFDVESCERVHPASPARQDGGREHPMTCADSVARVTSGSDSCWLAAAAGVCAHRCLRHNGDLQRRCSLEGGRGISISMASLSVVLARRQHYAVRSLPCVCVCAWTLGSQTSQRGAQAGSQIHARSVVCWAVRLPLARSLVWTAACSLA